MNKLFILLLFLGCFKLNAMKCEKVLQMPSEDAIYSCLENRGFRSFDSMTGLSEELGGDIQTIGNIERIIEKRVNQYIKHLRQPHILEAQLEDGTLELMKNAKSEILGIILQVGSLYN